MSICDLNKYLIQEILNFCMYEQIILFKNIKNKKIFKIHLQFEKNENFFLHPKDLKIRISISLNVITSYSLSNLICSFVSLKSQYFLVYINNSNGIELYDLYIKERFKLLQSSEKVFSCCKHLVYLNVDYIISSNCKNLYLFSSESNYDVKLVILEAHNEWILCCNLFISGRDLYIISSNNDNEFTRIWDIEGKEKYCYENENMNQIYSVDTWSAKEIDYFTLCCRSKIFIRNLKTGEYYRKFEYGNEYFYNFCFFKQNKKNYMIVSNKNLQIYNIDDNVLEKNIFCDNPKSIIKWNEKFLFCATKTGLIIVDTNKMCSELFSFNENIYCITKICLPEYGESLIVNNSKGNIVLFAKS